MSKVLVFRHVPFEHLGLIAGSFSRRGVEFVYADLPGDAPLPFPPSQASGLIFMGGPMSVNGRDSWIAAEVGYAADAMARGTPVLGVCLGSQIMATALGAPVYRNPVKEIGWFPVHWTDAASTDPLLAGLSAPETIFHWHGETFDLPSGADRLAYSQRCRNQAFRMGPKAWAFQFHLEVTPAMIADWCDEDANCGDVRELDHAIDPCVNAPRLAELAALVFDRWCALLS